MHRWNFVWHELCDGGMLHLLPMIDEVMGRCLLHTAFTKRRLLAVTERVSTSVYKRVPSYPIHNP